MYPGSPYFVPRVPVLCTPGPRTLYPGSPYFVPRVPVLRIRRAEFAQAFAPEPNVATEDQAPCPRSPRTRRGGRPTPQPGSTPGPSAKVSRPSPQNLPAEVSFSWHVSTRVHGEIVWKMAEGFSTVDLWRPEAADGGSFIPPWRPPRSPGSISVPMFKTQRGVLMFEVDKVRFPLYIRNRYASGGCYATLSARPIGAGQSHVLGSGAMVREDVPPSRCARTGSCLWCGRCLNHDRGAGDVQHPQLRWAP